MFLSSHGQILSDLNFWIFFIPAIFILSHITLLLIIIPQWLINGYFDPKERKEKRYRELESIANDLDLYNRTVAPQKNLNFFSWLVYQKKVRDYYTPYANDIGKLENDIWNSDKKIKPDSILRCFYGAIFSRQTLINILCTKDSVKPYIMIGTQRIPKGKNNSTYYRVIHFKSDTLNFPKCSVDPIHEWIDSISPNPDDINFISDEEFSKKFDLTGEDQAKIRALFNKNIRKQIIKNPNWTWKFDNNSILIKYRIINHNIKDMNDIKHSFKELSLLHNKLNKTNTNALPSKDEIESDTPKEIIDKKLYNKRMTTFGFLIGCGTLLTLFALFLLFVFFVRIDFRFLIQGIFCMFIGFPLLLYAKSEWKRNKKLKTDGKVTKN